jgi:uncharacterized NAD-dependent epimerase/dehydratase family protein
MTFDFGPWTFDGGWGEDKTMITATILARGCFSQNRAKTAHGMIRHGRRYRIVNVIDETLTGQDAGDVLGLGRMNIPIVDKILPGADILIIGVTPERDRLPQEWKEDIRTAIDLEMDIASVVPNFLNDEPELVRLANDKEITLWDLQAPLPNEELRVASDDKSPVPVILSYGTDGYVGKRTTLLEMYKAALDSGINAGFVATGQTGILIGCDEGIVINRLPADFIAGAVEKMVLNVAAQGKQLIFVEGQGSLLHPAYSSSAIGILHGAQPDYIVVTHDPAREIRYNFPEVKMPEIEQELELIKLLSPHSKIVGIALNCQKNEDWLSVIEEYKIRTDLLTVDVVNQNYGGGELLKKILSDGSK